MSTETPPEQEGEQPDPSNETPSGKPRAAHIREMVADRIAGFGNEVIGAVVANLVEQAKEQRANAVLSALKQLDELEKERRKIKPDIITYNEDSSIKDTAWTKEALGAKKQNFEQTKKLNDALNKAFDTPPDWTKLFELTKGK